MWGFLVSASKREKLADAKREQALRAVLLEESSQKPQSEEAKKAIAFCINRIDVYQSWFEWNEARWFAWQKVMIVGGVVATLAGVISVPGEWIKWYPASLGWLRGVPAAIVTIAAGYLSSFTYREDAVRHELAANALLNELAKYQVGAAPYNKSEPENTSVFLNIICRIVEADLQNWSRLVGSTRADSVSSEKSRDRKKASVTTA